jgi:hypothetical protein
LEALAAVVLLLVGGHKVLPEIQTVLLALLIAAVEVPVPVSIQASVGMAEAEAAA